MRRWFVPAAMLVAAVPVAFASGYHIYEQGAKASGQAVAFVARADDASAVFYNPAAMTQLPEGASIDLGVSLVLLGNTEFRSNASDLTPGLPPQIQPISGALFGSGPTTFDMEDNVGTPVHFNYAHRLAGTNFAFGLGVSNPFGLMTEWTDPAFKGRFSAVQTDLRTYMVNGNVAYRFGDSNFSVAVGADYIYADLKDFSRRVSLLPLGAAPTDSEPLINLQGDGSGWGWNAALHWKSEKWAAGASYRSKLDVDVEGDLVVTDVPAGSVPELPQFGPLQGAPYSVLFQTVAAKGTLKLPAQYAIGLAYTGLERFEFEVNMSRLEWSHFDEVAIDVIEPVGLMEDSVVVENWDDTTAYRFGAAYDLAERHQLRAGAYVESNPIPEKYLRPSIPDGDRTALTLGYGYTGGKWKLDAYWLHIMVDDVVVGTEDVDLTPTSSAFDIIEEQSRIGEYSSDIDLVGLTFSYHF
jgi:long-chain fatty acid transport protein